MGPRAKMRQISGEADDIYQKQKFEGTAVKLNVFRNSDSRFRPSAYGSIRPQTEETALAWRSFPTPVTAFSIYIAHLESGFPLFRN